MNIFFNTSIKKSFSVIFFLFVLFFVNFNSASAQNAEKNFKLFCGVCHTLGTNKLVGPGLEGVTKRVPSEAWMAKWIRNSQEVIQGGDAYGKKLLADNKGIPMPPFPFLKDEEIAALIKYLQPAPQKEVVTKVPATREQNRDGKGSNSVLLLLISITCLIIIIRVLRGVKHSLKNIQNEKSGKPKEEAIGPWKELKIWMKLHKRAVAVILLISFGGFLYSSWYSLMEIGVYTGYQPTQPMSFSHKIHAGDNAINCVYCHPGAEKSKTAGFPSASICMNCHKAISKGPITGTAEIAKIYDAVGWDPKLGAYTKPEKPVQWVKVHVLADFVFFSHQQHVVVGKQACASCHGDLKTMTVAQQTQPMTMVWCINCHRTTEVPGIKDNPYYESLHKKLVEKYKGQPITVDKIGGIECGKCHY